MWSFKSLALVTLGIGFLSNHVWVVCLIHYASIIFIVYWKSICSLQVGMVERVCQPGEKKHVQMLQNLAVQLLTASVLTDFRGHQSSP